MDTLLASLGPILAFFVAGLCLGIFKLCDVIGHHFVSDDDAIFCTRCGKKR